MQSKQQFRRSPSNMIARPLAMAIVFALTVILTQSAEAQTYRVIYTFDSGPNAWDPAVGLSIDAAGNLYGTTVRGGGQGDCPGPGGCGAVFELMSTGSDWIETLLHGFNGPYDFGRGPGPFGATDGAYPYSRAIVGPDGNVYGTVLQGATGDAGTVYQLTRSGSGWNENILHRFTGDTDGGSAYGDVAFDGAGNLYGTTVGGGPYRWGTVFLLTRSGSGWTKSTLYGFQGGSDGAWPYSGVVFDGAGNLYGTTGAGGADACRYGGPNCGTVYELTPSGSGWTEKILYNFHNGNDGGGPSALIFDLAGNLYGTICGGSHGGASVFMLSPSGDSWNFRVLYALSATSCAPLLGGLAMDAAGNLYGALVGGGAYGRGSIYKLTRSGSSWWYAGLYDFTGNSDGGEPNGSLIFDRNGNLHGTTQYGGVSHYCGGAPHTGCGVVFELTP